MSGRLSEALKIDRALTLGQVRRWYGPEVDRVAERFPVVGLTLPATGKTRYTRKFWVVHHPQWRVHQAELAHTLGLAELRHLVGALPGQWVMGGADRPDAIWQQDGRSMAVEYDCGTYSHRVLLEKMAAYTRGYDGQIWGVAGALRQVSVQRALAGRGKVWVAAWSQD